MMWSIGDIWVPNIIWKQGGIYMKKRLFFPRFWRQSRKTCCQLVDPGKKIGSEEIAWDEFGDGKIPNETKKKIAKSNKHF